MPSPEEDGGLQAWREGLAAPERLRAAAPGAGGADPGALTMLSALVMETEAPSAVAALSQMPTGWTDGSAGASPEASTPVPPAFRTAEVGTEADGLPGLASTSMAPSGTLSAQAPAYPFDCVCYVTVSINGTSYRGSGVIIGPHTVLTAAHMVWDAGSGESATNVQVYPGYSTGYRVAIPAVAIHYNAVDDSGGLLSMSQSQKDFAVIDVGQNLRSYGWFQVGTDYAGGTSNISGYPAANGSAQQTTSGALTADKSYALLDYGAALKVSPGSSGGPIWIDEGASGAVLPSVVGVVSTGSWGARITAADLAQISGWVAQDTALFRDVAGDIAGSVFNDHLIGDSGANQINGLAGNDVLTGGAGPDTFIFQAGSGADTITDFSDADGDRIDLTALTVFHGLSDVLAHATQSGPNVVMSLGSGSVTLTGWTLGRLAANDFRFNLLPTVGPGVGGAPTTGSGALNGGAGDDWLQGQGGADTLHGGPGSDYLDGGAGVDIAAYDGVYRQYVVAPRAATVTGGPEGGSDVLVNVERVQFVDGYLALSPTDTAGQVYRVYAATLDRTPDPVGFANWTHALDSGASLQTVVNGFVNSSEFQARFGALDDAAFLTLLYRNVLHRDPDASGLGNWLAYLNQGHSRSEVVLGFSESQEEIAALAAPVQQGLWVQDAAAAQTFRLYDALLGRRPDAAGLTNWTHTLEGGASLQSVADAFLGSSELQQRYGGLSDSAFLTLLYGNVLHRAPDAAGLSSWLAQLGAGASRAQVALGFSESAEHVADTAPYVDQGIWLA